MAGLGRYPEVKAATFTGAFTVRDRPGRADVKVTGAYTSPRPEEMRRAVEALSASRGQGKVPDFRAG